MQYYVKIFNSNTQTHVGYYKTTGIGCVSKLKNGMKYWLEAEAALEVAEQLNNGFLRDSNKKYYIPYAIVIGDSTKNGKDEKKTTLEREEELKYALETFIRKNSIKK